ncbi:MAG: response regulator transcription factor, partial [Microbacterium sp.]
MPASIRVLIVDDEALMRAGIRLMVDGAVVDGATISVVGEASDGAAALAEVARLDPDVVLMDVRMPRMTGIDAVRELTARGERARIVMLTAFDTDEFLLDALRAGAISFLLKDSAPQSVLGAIAEAAAGRPRISPTALARLISLATAQG